LDVVLSCEKTNRNLAMYHHGLLNADILSIHMKGIIDETENEGY